MLLYLLAPTVACLWLPMNTQAAHVADRSVTNGYRYMAETNLYYKEHNTAVNWSEAIATCKAEGGQLATPFTSNEALVLTLLFTCKTFCSWVGIHDSDIEGTFTTLNGTLATNIHTKWQPGEPNNAGGQEDCVCVKKDGTYNDVPCEWVNTFMCTKHEVEPSDKALQNAAPPLNDYKYMPENKWHYKLHKEPKMWLDAVTTCQAEGAQLAAPTTEQEVRAIASLHDSSITFYTWIGMHDSLTEGHFITLDGTPATDLYTKWTANEPNDYGGCEDCVTMSKDGSYNDGPCHWSNVFVCIKRQSEINRMSDKAGPSSPSPAGGDDSSIHSPKAGCPLPEYPYKGRYTVANYNKKVVPGDIVQQFTILQYSCAINFDLSTKFSICQEDNVWSSSPECVKRCDMITSYSAEFHCYSPAGTSTPCAAQLSSGSTILSKCKEGHLPVEPLGVLTCQDGRWDKSTPKCKPDCGIEKGLGISHVIHGFTVKKNTFPWHVAVYQSVDNDFEQICGGSLVQSHIVISDVHREEFEKEEEKGFEKFDLEKTAMKMREDLENSFISYRDELEKSVKKNRDELEKIIKRNREELENSIKRIREESTKSVTGNREELEKSVTRNNKEMDKTVTRSSEDLEKTITRTKEELEMSVTRNREELKKSVTMNRTKD